MGERHGRLKRSFLPEELKPLLDEAGFNGVIAVQARQTLEETAWLLELADARPWILGVVGWVDLCSDEIERQLETFSQHPKFVGVRHIVHDEPDDRFMERADFRRGIASLASYGLTYDLLVYEKHLPWAQRLVEAFPEQPFVLDHIGKPDIRNQSVRDWQRSLKALAENRNVWCKLSGMVTEADWNRWTETDFIPYLDAVLAAFGPDRLMIGSDWPVCTLAGDYRSVTGIVLRYFEGFPKDIQDRVLGGNCARFYGIRAAGME